MYNCFSVNASSMQTEASKTVSFTDSDESRTRKRVGKACDRCRLKKSKCDGRSPCGRCKLDNFICVFGQRKRSQDRIIPRGYLEMVEQQQVQVVAAVQKMYRLLVASGQWPGEPLKQPDGKPSIHDILARLGILEQKSPATSEAFEDDLEALQSRLVGSKGKSSTDQARPRSCQSEDGESSESNCSSPRIQTASTSSLSSCSRKRPRMQSHFAPETVSSPLDLAKSYKRELQHHPASAVQQQKEPLVPLSTMTAYTTSPLIFNYCDFNIRYTGNEYPEMFDSFLFLSSQLTPPLGHMSMVSHANEMACDPRLNAFQYSD